MKDKKTHVRYFWINVNNICNLSCPYCYTSACKVNPNEPFIKQGLSFAHIKRLLLECQKINVESVIFSGGEPSLRQDLMDILDYSANEAKLKTILVTNGTILNKDMISKFYSWNIELQVSVDAINPDIYLKCRGAPVLKKVLQNIDLLLEYEVAFALAATITTINEDHIEDIVKFALRKGIQSLHLAEVKPLNKPSRELFVPYIYPVLKKLYELQKYYYPYIGINIIEHFVYPIILDFKRKAFCNAMEGNALEIKDNGDIHLCVGIGSPLGNTKWTRLGSITDLCNSYPYKYSIDDVDKCCNCKYKYICGGGCRYIAYFFSHGDTNARHPSCISYKNFIEDIKQDAEAGKLDSYADYIKKIRISETEYRKYL